MVILSQTLITKYLQDRTKEVHVSFEVLDGGDAFVLTDIVSPGALSRRSAKGVLRFVSASQDVAPDVPLLHDSEVMVIVWIKEDSAGESVSEFRSSAWVRGEDGQIEPRSVQVIPVREAMFSRTKGLYETDVLQEKTVLMIGLGSGGGLVALELAKAGVGRFILVDHDRLEIGNISRHPCGVSDLGRFKTKAVRDLILDRNPFALVETFEEEVCWNGFPQLRDLVRRADLVFCGTDNRPSRVLVNLACISEDRACIYGGAFRRAYGGQVLRVIPGQTMCYQCFIDTLVDDPTDQEISSEVQATRIAYSDRPVPIEPGLASDIAPIAIMCVKLGILEMLRGVETSLKSLYEDLPGVLFQWLNRREEGTDYAKLEPLDKGGDGLRILAWYGIEAERNPACPVCGDFLGAHAGADDYRPSGEQVAAFAASPCDGGDER